jgi:hypothetical protein
MEVTAMTWYWYLFMVFLIFNVGFVCGAWLGGSSANGLLGTKSAVARFTHARSVNCSEDLQAQKGSV